MTEGIMRYKLAVVVFLLAFVSGPIAQNPTVTWLSYSSGSMSVGSDTACPSPAPGTTTYCGTQVSANGTAYVTLQGAQGPPGTIPVTLKATVTCAAGKGTVASGYTSSCTFTNVAP